MAKQVFESHDLLRLIYSFGSPEHRMFTRRLKSELQSQARQFDDYFQDNRDIYPDITTCFYKHSKRELELYLTSFKRCFCCHRHSKNMPNLSNKKIVITGPSVFDNSTTYCDCPCRSLSRDFIHHLNVRIEPPKFSLK